MAELAMPLFNMAILGSFLAWAVMEYRALTRQNTAKQAG